MAAEQAGLDRPQAPPAPGQAWFMLGVLLVFNTLNYLDRNIISILMQPISQDLSLTDTELGLVTGVAFSLFFATAGIPIALLADRRIRRNIAAGCMALWSLATFACGQAQGFWQFFAARTLVGVGEAGVTPVAYSMIGDLFGKERRSSALAIYSVGAVAGLVGGFAVGGYLEAAVGWRATLAIVGLPGIAFAIWMRIYVREPVRGTFDEPDAGAASPGDMLALTRNRAFMWMIIGSALYQLTSLNGIDQWLPVYFERALGLSRPQIGTMMALSSGIGSVTGMLLGGIIGDRLSRLGARGLVLFAVSVLLLAVPFKLVLFMTDSPRLIFAMLLSGAVVGSLAAAPMLTYLQSLLHSRNRASGAALNLLLAALIGWGLGPFLAGAFSDLLRPLHAEDSLAISLFVLHLIGFFAPFLLLVSLRYANRRAAPNAASA